MARVIAVLSSLAVPACLPLPPVGVIVVGARPPADRVEEIGPAPGAAYIWIGGYWRWEHDGFLWVSGRWSRPDPDFRHWVPGYWVHTRRGWYWVDGHWR